MQACGICHSDSFTKEGCFPASQYPARAGTRESPAWSMRSAPACRAGQPGQRVGVGWHGGHCGYCDSCRRGDFVTCQVAAQVPGITYDGGYADYMIAPAAALALIPDELTAVEAGAADVRRHHHLQRAAQQRRAAGRPGRRARPRRPRPSRRAVRRQDGLQHRRDRARRRTRSRSPSSSARGTTSTARRRIRPRSCAKLGGARVILATVTERQGDERARWAASASTAR